MIFVFPYILSKGIRGITLFPFIILRKKAYKDDIVLLNHEKIHLRQQIEMLILPFYIWYVVEFFIYWMKLRDTNVAYLSISFEREAYFNENNLTYLQERKFWSFTFYLKQKKDIK